MIETVARIRVELERTDPPVWRELDVPMSTTLAALHDIIQIVMRWWDYHLYEFRVGDRTYGVPYPDDEDFERKVYRARSIRLNTVIERGFREFLYVYDYGDNWRHRITVEDIRQGDAETDYPCLVAGGRRAPPEDVGGVSGFEEFLEAVANPRHEDHDRLLEWYGRPFNPDDIDEDLVRMLLKDLAARRRGPLLSHRTGNRSGG